MNNAEKIMKRKANIKAELDKALPKSQSDRLWREATARLDGYLARYSTLPRGVHIHTESRILPSAAIYLTVKEVIDLCGDRKEASEADESSRDAKPVHESLGPDDKKAVRCGQRF